MSNVIKITQEHAQALVPEFLEALTKYKMNDGRISFNKTLHIDRKATIYFTPLAWVKMWTLIKEFDKEVAWHGVAKRLDNEDGYVISDILVYPQTVTGTTVNTDQSKYEMWLMSHEDDVFNNIRMQGHSHVNMGVTPSAVDLSFQSEILNQLKDDMFYIFMIWNKSLKFDAEIFDMKKNVLFNTSDIAIKFTDTNFDYDNFIKESKDSVKDYVHVTKKDEKKEEPQKKENNIKGLPNSNGVNTQQNTAKEHDSGKRKGKMIPASEYCNPSGYYHGNYDGYDGYDGYGYGYPYRDY